MKTGGKLARPEGLLSCAFPNANDSHLQSKVTTSAKGGKVITYGVNRVTSGDKVTGNPMYKGLLSGR